MVPEALDVTVTPPATSDGVLLRSGISSSDKGVPVTRWGSVVLIVGSDVTVGEAAIVDEVVAVDKAVSVGEVVAADEAASAGEVVAVNEAVSVDEEVAVGVLLDAADRLTLPSSVAPNVELTAPIALGLKAVGRLRAAVGRLGETGDWFDGVVNGNR
eukprot:gb/GECG01002460.1/.p1 GENE.gb/GECG01002460.1/~~gb/GECG01002460.1/.p1  ORF type:complete len:157 (+),score=26.55 gb/GECG01002460.1/:1-471(+)